MANSEPLQVSIIGMPGSGKTVLVSTMAMRMVQRVVPDVNMTPAGAGRHRTHKYISQNWHMLNNGQWPESTPIGEQVNLQWELKTRSNTASIHFFDCAGQDIHTIFSNDDFNPDKLSKDDKPIYNILIQSDIVIVLINMEDLIGRNARQAAENSADIDLMISTLLENTIIERRVALVINQYDRYKAEVDNLFKGDIYKYLQQRLPILYRQHMRQKNMMIIPVAAIAETNTIEINGVISLIPAPNFKSYNLESLIYWVADCVDELSLWKKSRAIKAQKEALFNQQQERWAEFKSQAVDNYCLSIPVVCFIIVFACYGGFLACCVTFLVAILECMCIWLYIFTPITNSDTNAGDRITRTFHDKITRDERVKTGLKAGDRTIKMVNGVEFAFRYCPAGTFIMGSPESEWDNTSNNMKYDQSQHIVTLSHSFWILETEVTQKQWQAIMDTNPSNFQSDNLPVESISWYDCQEFCKIFNSISGLKIDLPTEAQWEYACRAGTTTAYNFGSSLNGDKANCNGHYPLGTIIKGKYLKNTTPVGSYSPNAWGIYDMHGNVIEWCADRYGTYPRGTVTDPTGSSRGKFRVARGGSWHTGARICHSAYRKYYLPISWNNELGFRVVLVR